MFLFWNFWIQTYAIIQPARLSCRPGYIFKISVFSDHFTLSRCHSEKKIAVSQIRNSDFKRLNWMNFSTLCTILVTFGPETPEFTLITIAPFVAIWQKIGISRQISQNILDLAGLTLHVWYMYWWGWLSQCLFGGRSRNVAMAAS